MPRFVIEREIPNAGKLSEQELQGIAQKSCNVLKNMGPEIQWVQSFVTDNKISQVRAIIDPTTSEIPANARL